VGSAEEMMVVDVEGLQNGLDESASRRPKTSAYHSAERCLLRFHDSQLQCESAAANHEYHIEGMAFVHRLQGL